VNVALRKPMTVDEFLAWENRQEAKHEFDGFAAVAMVGVSAAHSTIQMNLLGALRDRLRGKPCRPHGSELRMKLAQTVRYPDAMVICTPIANTAHEVTDPVVIFEILSDTTAETDLGAKNREYRDTSSVQRYVIIHQDAPAVTMFARQGHAWLGTLHGRNDTIAMPEIGIALPIAELYDGLEFPHSDGAQDALRAEADQQQ